MSSSRSLASARTKRAGGGPVIGNPSDIEQQRSVTQAAAQAPAVKLTLPQAMNQISLRLNNLELFMETTTTVIDDIQEFHEKTTDKYIVDSEVFTSIISRIEHLESTQTKSRGDISTTPVVPSSVNKDIDELKNHLIRLQTYVMETNAKLHDIVFSGNGESMLSFNDVFSDSHHPTPPTLMRSLTVTQPTAEQDANDDMDYSVEEIHGGYTIANDSRGMLDNSSEEVGNEQHD